MLMEGEREILELSTYFESAGEELDALLLNTPTFKPSRRRDSLRSCDDFDVEGNEGDWDEYLESFQYSPRDKIFHDIKPLNQIILALTNDNDDDHQFNSTTDDIDGFLNLSPKTDKFLSADTQKYHVSEDFKRRFEQQEKVSRDTLISNWNKDDSDNDNEGEGEGVHDTIHNNIITTTSTDTYADTTIIPELSITSTIQTHEENIDTSNNESSNIQDMADVHIYTPQITPRHIQLDETVMTIYDPDHLHRIDTNDGNPGIISPKNITLEIHDNTSSELITSTISPNTLSDSIEKILSLSPNSFTRASPDNRVLGDMMGWYNGPKLTINGIKYAYGGLYDTLLHTNTYTSVYVQEYIIRPDITLSAIMNLLATVAKASNYIFTRRQRSQGLLSHPPRTYIITPEETPRQSVTNIIQAVINPNNNSNINSMGNPYFRSSNGNALMNTMDGEEDDIHIWDVVDIQVCISKEVKQRVILCQFLQKNRLKTTTIPSYTGTSSALSSSPSMSGVSRNKLNNSNTNTITINSSSSYTNSSSSSSYNNTTMSSDFESMDVNNDHPQITKFTYCLLNHLNEARYCLSNLYQLIPDDVCLLDLSSNSSTTTSSSNSSSNNETRSTFRSTETVSSQLSSYGMDPHFITQIENLYREQMWISLEKELNLMDTHYSDIENQHIQFIKSLTTMYQQHNVPYLDQLSHTNKTNQDKLKQESNLYRNRTFLIHQDKEYNNAFNLAIPKSSGKGNALGNTVGRSSSNIVPSITISLRDSLTSETLQHPTSPLISNQKTTTNSDHFEDNHDDNSQAKNSNIHVNDITRLTESSHNMITVVVEEEEKEGEGVGMVYPHYKDGMSKCLSHMELLTQQLRMICDREMTYRLQKLNKVIIHQTSYWHDYIHQLLVTLNESITSKHSGANRNFIKLFDEVSITTSVSTYSRFLSSNLDKLSTATKARRFSLGKKDPLKSTTTGSNNNNNSQITPITTTSNMVSNSIQQPLNTSGNTGNPLLSFMTPMKWKSSTTNTSSSSSSTPHTTINTPTSSSHNQGNTPMISTSVNPVTTSTTIDINTSDRSQTSSRTNSAAPSPTKTQQHTTTSTITTGTRSSITNTTSQNRIITPVSHQVMLYTCAVLVSNLSIPGHIYLTSQAIYVITGVQLLGFNIKNTSHREAYALSDVCSVTTVQKSSLPFITANSLQISIFDDMKILYITPMMVPSQVLLNWILNIKEHLT